MLSMEQRTRQKTYAFKNGARNLGWVIGFVTNMTPRGGLIMQTRNENHGIPFLFQQHDKVPKMVKEGRLVKFVVRVEGGRDAETDEPSAVLRVLDVDTPKVIELPPQQVWDLPKPAAAPDAGVAPKAGQVSPKSIDKNSSNVVGVAGIVTGMRLRRAGAVQEDGSQSNACLYLLVQQTADPKDAINVRLYGSKAPQYYSKLLIGREIAIRRGKIRVDAKEVEQDAQDGEVSTVKVTKYPYLAADDLYEPDENDIPKRDEWLKQEWIVALRDSTRQRLAQRQQAKTAARRPAREDADDGVARVGDSMEQAAPAATKLSAAEMLAALGAATASSATVEAAGT
jgi:hypothetical protein